MGNKYLYIVVKVYISFASFIKLRVNPCTYGFVQLRKYSFIHINRHVSRNERHIIDLVRKNQPNTISRLHGLPLVSVGPHQFRYFCLWWRGSSVGSTVGFRSYIVLNLLLISVSLAHNGYKLPSHPYHLS